MNYIYCCCNDKTNNCPHKNECKRLLDIKKGNDNCASTLYKESCTDKNGHILFIKEESEIVE